MPDTRPFFTLTTINNKRIKMDSNATCLYIHREREKDGESRASYRLIPFRPISHSGESSIEQMVRLFFIFIPPLSPFVPIRAILSLLQAPIDMIIFPHPCIHQFATHLALMKLSYQSVVVGPDRRNDRRTAFSWIITLFTSLSISKGALNE